jgi:hypothetical protein
MMWMCHIACVIVDGTSQLPQKRSHIINALPVKKRVSDFLLVDAKNRSEFAGIPFEITGFA